MKVGRKVFGAALWLALPLAIAAQTATPANPYEEEIHRFEIADQTRPPEKGGIVFVGSSSIRRWETLKQDFPGRNVINRGFGGSQVSDSVYFADRIVIPYEPKMVVFFAGTNDIAAGKSAETVFADYKAFVEKVHAKLPRTPIVFLAITPAPSRQNKWKEDEKANALVKAYSTRGRNLKFVDTYKAFLTPEGGPRPELFVEDQLHLKPAGYAIWIKALDKVLPKPNRTRE